MTALKRGELERALKSPDTAIRLWLFAGPDEAASADAARKTLKIFSDPADPMAATDIAASDLSSDPGKLADEAASVSMFGGSRAIRVTGAGEGARAAVELLLAAPAAGNPVVMTAGDLSKSSGLRKLAEAAAQARILISYPLDTRDAMRWLSERAGELGLKLAPGVAERLLAATASDIGILGSELDKFALYLDARRDNPMLLEAGHLALLGADSAEEDMFALIAAITAGRAVAAERQMHLLQGGSPIPALRAMARRLLQLADLRAMVDSGTAPAAAVRAMRPPVFWKEQDMLAAAVENWSMRRIERAMASMLAAERAIKQPSAPGEALGWQALIGLVGEGRSRRR